MYVIWTAMFSSNKMKAGVYGGNITIVVVQIFNANRHPRHIEVAADITKKFLLYVCSENLI